MVSRAVAAKVIYIIDKLISISISLHCTVSLNLCSPPGSLQAEHPQHGGANHAINIASAIMNSNGMLAKQASLPQLLLLNVVSLARTQGFCKFGICSKLKSLLAY